VVSYDPSFKERTTYSENSAISRLIYHPSTGAVQYGFTSIALLPSAPMTLITPFEWWWELASSPRRDLWDCYCRLRRLSIGVSISMSNSGFTNLTRQQHLVETHDHVSDRSILKIPGNFHVWKSVRDAVSATKIYEVLLINAAGIRCVLVYQHNGKCVGIQHHGGLLPGTQCYWCRATYVRMPPHMWGLYQEDRGIKNIIDSYKGGERE